MQEVREESRVRGAPGGARRFPLPGLFLYLSLGLGLAAGSSALTVGDLQVRSTLGQPFSGLVQVDAAAGEIIRQECFSSGAGANAVPGVPLVSDVRFVLDNRAGTSFLRIIGRNPIREPLAQVVLQVRCPGLPRLTRSFILLLDPATIAQAPPEISSANATRSFRSPIASGQRVVGDIQPGTRYTVRPGDTLSGIASRINGRAPYTVWPLAALIKDGNPAAFENGRSDRLITGASLAIPDPNSVIASTGPDTGLDNQGGTAAIVRETQANSGSTASLVRRIDSATEVGPGARSSRSSRSLFDAPLVLGEPVGNADLEYLVLTPALSTLSLDRIEQRGETPTASPVEQSRQASQAAPPADGPASQPTDQSVAGTDEPGAYPSLWYWLAGALILLLGAVLVLVVAKRRKETTADSDEESPWEMNDSDDLPPVGTPEAEDKPVAMVYDDFEGTFVSVEPLVESADAEGAAAGQAETPDPEKDVLTHLMPTVDDSAEVTGIDKEGSESNDAREDFARARDRADPTGQINVTTLEESEPDFSEEGWVELDFEATQILEQDYLAEYAAKLKDAGEKAEPLLGIGSEQEPENTVDEGVELDAEPLILAHEMLASPDSEGPEELELAAADDSDEEELIELAEPDERDLPESLSGLRLEDAADDNVVAIEKGKSKGKDKDQGPIDTGQSKQKGRKES